MPQAFKQFLVLITSFADDKFLILEISFDKDPKIKALWDIDLSPGNSIFPFIGIVEYNIKK